MSFSRTRLRLEFEKLEMLECDSVKLDVALC